MTTILLIMRNFYSNDSFDHRTRPVTSSDVFRNHGRYMTKGGYVDSSRRIRSLYRQQDGSPLAKHDSSKGNLLLPSLGKSSSSAPPTTTPSTRKNRAADGTELSPAVSTSNELKKQAKEFEKQMRLIKVRSVCSVTCPRVPDAVYSRVK